MEMNIIPNFLDSALTPIAKESGERLADIISLVFTPVIKAKAKRDKNIELFLKELDDKVRKIPEENIQNPPLHIVGPTMDNVFKFYHDQEYLRSMYSTLIASSMNSNMNVHPSYIEIIRHLSSVDACVFSIHLQNMFGSDEIIEDSIGYLTFGNTDIIFDTISMPYNIYYLLQNKAYLIDKSVIDSMQNLIRIGLLYIQKHEIPINILQNFNIKIENKYNNLCVYLYCLLPTDFGMNFAKVCCTSMNRREYLMKNVNGILETIICNEASMEYSVQ